jgi:hypothetical protein
MGRAYKYKCTRFFFPSLDVTGRGNDTRKPGEIAGRVVLT